MVEFTLFIFGSGIGASHPVLQRNFQSIKVRLTPLRYWDENNIP